MECESRIIISNIFNPFARVQLNVSLIFFLICIWLLSWHFLILSSFEISKCSQKEKLIVKRLKEKRIIVLKTGATFGSKKKHAKYLASNWNSWKIRTLKKCNNYKVAPQHFPKNCPKLCYITLGILNLK